MTACALVCALPGFTGYVSTVAALKAQGLEWFYCSPEGVLYGSRGESELVCVEGVAMSAKQVVAEFLRDAVQPHLGGLLPRPLLEIIASLAAWPLLWG